MHTNKEMKDSTRQVLIFIAAVLIIFGLINNLDYLIVKALPKLESKKEYFHEEQCRTILEEMTGKKFNKIRPDFLQNPATGKNMELDGYNAELNIAFEYQGEQHYKYIPYFHKKYEDFLKQLERDELKRRLCDEHGLSLIIIPYTVKDLKSFIEEKMAAFKTKL